MMPEVIVKYKNARALKALQDFAKTLDIVIEKPVISNSIQPESLTKRLPITFAKKPDVTALAGIWQDREITIEQLRKEAWGERL